VRLNWSAARPGLVIVSLMTCDSAVAWLPLCPVYQKNSAYHSGIKRAPYKALFGTDPKVGLSSTSLPAEVLQTLHSEDDLLAICPNPTEAAAEPSTETSVIPETLEHEQLTSVSELSVITSEPSDNGHRPDTAGPTLDMSETLEEKRSS